MAIINLANGSDTISVQFSIAGTSQSNIPVKYWLAQFSIASTSQSNIDFHSNIDSPSNVVSPKFTSRWFLISVLHHLIFLSLCLCRRCGSGYRCLTKLPRQRRSLSSCMLGVILYRQWWQRNMCENICFGWLYHHLCGCTEFPTTQRYAGVGVLCTSNTLEFFIIYTLLLESN